MASPETTPHVNVWTDANGIQHTLTTPRSAPESVHLRRVKKAQELFPEVR